MKQETETRKNDPVVFALSTQTWLIKKHPVDEESNIIDPNFNARTYTKKAYKAFLQGKSYFTYKGTTYVVPKMQRSTLDKHLDSINLDENGNLIVPEESIENKIIEQWG